MKAYARPNHLFYDKRSVRKNNNGDQKDLRNSL